LAKNHADESSLWQTVIVTKSTDATADQPNEKMPQDEQESEPSAIGVGIDHGA
jgi:hypothetical protein